MVRAHTVGLRSHLPTQSLDLLQWRRPRGTTRILCNACGIYYTR
jgi:hypothetical protein